MTQPWQVEFHVIPRRALMAGAALSSKLDDTDWWAAHTLPADYERRLADITAPGAAPATQVQRWGAPDGNSIDVWLDNGRVSAVMTRVDVRRLDSRFGASLLMFVRTADAVLVRKDGLVVEPQIESFAAALRGSKAWQYASDPAAFLAAQADDDEDDDE